jgi:hypothetical protein
MADIGICERESKVCGGDIVITGTRGGIFLELYPEDASGRGMTFEEAAELRRALAWCAEPFAEPEEVYTITWEPAPLVCASCSESLDADPEGE